MVWSIGSAYTSGSARVVTMIARLTHGPDTDATSLVSKVVNGPGPRSTRTHKERSTNARLTTLAVSVGLRAVASSPGNGAEVEGCSSKSIIQARQAGSNRVHHQVEARRTESIGVRGTRRPFGPVHTLGASSRPIRPGRCRFCPLPVPPLPTRRAVPLLQRAPTLIQHRRFRTTVRLPKPMERMPIQGRSKAWPRSCNGHGTEPLQRAAVAQHRTERNTIMLKKTLAAITACLLSLSASQAFASGAVRVECWGRCDLVNLGDICDSFAPASKPVALSCVSPSAGGSGTDNKCGGYASCRSYGSLARSDLLSSYCNDVGGFDAVVTCSTSATTFIAAEPMSKEKPEDK